MPAFIWDSRTGRIHTENQDCVIARPPSSDGGMFLIAVADGISSCPFGRSVARWLIEEHLGKDEFALERGIAPRKVVARYLAGLNARFRDEFADLPEMLESGACLSLAVHLAGETHCFWVGDSPIFETSIQGNRISTRLVSRPDSRSGTSITDWFGGTSRFDLKHVELPIETAIVTITSDGAVHDAQMLNTCKDWRLHAFFAAMKHEQSNKDTSLRIKRTLRNRFVQGGVIQFIIFGYIKPLGAKNDDELQKDPAAEAIMKEWFERLDRGDTFSEIADWLNSLHAPTGPFCRSERWTCAMVGRVTRNRILKGVRERNRKESKRFNKTGKHKAVKAKPEDLLERSCPHLAFFEAHYYDRILAKVRARNAKYRRCKIGEDDPCANRPKKRVRYPGQSIRCGVCGRLLVFGAHGRRDHLMCTGAREYVCWNSISLSGPLAAQRVAEMVLGEIESLEDFDPVFMQLVNEEAQKLDTQRDRRLRELGTIIEQRRREIQNVIKFIRGGRDSPSVAEDLRKLEVELSQLEAERAEIERMPSQILVIPSATEIRQLARESVKKLALESYEFAKLMRSLLTDFFVFPCRSCDGKDLVLRGTARLQLANLLPDQRLRDTLRAPLERVLNVDLFEAPQRIRHREQVVAQRREMTEREAADRLGITKTAAQYAARVDRLMRRLGLADPYVQLTQPPMDYPKMRRHLHPRYRFDPLPGFGSA